MKKDLTLQTQETTMPGKVAATIKARAIISNFPDPFSSVVFDFYFLFFLEGGWGVVCNER